MTQVLNKVSSIEEVNHLFFDGMTLMYGGFGGVGSPPTLIEAIKKKGSHS